MAVLILTGSYEKIFSETVLPPLYITLEGIFLKGGQGGPEIVLPPFLYHLMRIFFLMGLISLVIAGSAFASPAFASEIRQLPYSYSYEFAVGPSEPAFVVCDHCSAGKGLVLAPKALTPKPFKKPELVLRVSAPVKAAQNKKIQLVSSDEKETCMTSKRMSPRKLFLTVHFDFDSYALRKAVKEKLKAAFPRIDHLRGPVSVTGYTDDIGTRAYNMRLSTERAGAVAEYLKELGVIPAVVIGKGECCPVSSIKKFNRRVEIKEVAIR